MKDYADAKLGLSTSNVTQGDLVLLKNLTPTKSSPVYNPTPGLVIHRRGNQVHVKINGKTLLRPLHHCKRIPRDSNRDVWKENISAWEPEMKNAYTPLIGDNTYEEVRRERSPPRMQIDKNEFRRRVFDDSKVSVMPRPPAVSEHGSMTPPENEFDSPRVQVSLDPFQYTSSGRLVKPVNRYES